MSDPTIVSLVDKAQTQTGADQDATFRELNKYVVDQAWFAPYAQYDNVFALKDVTITPQKFATYPPLWNHQGRVIENGPAPSHGAGLHPIVPCTYRSQSMLSFVLRRLGSGLVLMFVIATATFFLLNSTGQDPARQILGPTASVDQVEQKQVELGLNQPIIVQYLDWLARAVRGDLGTSWYSNQPVPSILAQSLPPTLSMVIGAVILTTIIGTAIGVAAAIRRGAVDRGLQVASTLVQAIPNFVVALLLALVFAVQLGLFPATGYTPFESSPTDWARSICTLPVIALAVGAIAAIAMQVRGSMIDVLKLDYVRTLESEAFPGRACSSSTPCATPRAPRSRRSPSCSSSRSPDRWSSRRSSTFPGSAPRRTPRQAAAISPW